MTFETNKSLKEFNTFGIDSKADRYISVTSEAMLKNILQEEQKDELLILGGGSNVLFRNDWKGLVLHLNLKGITVTSEDEDHIELTVQAGENWHAFVEYCLARNYGGLENLSLIPGNVGTAPIQNIGAYGVELKDCFVSCTAIHRKTLESHTFTLEECKFGYRNSIFKNEVKGEFIITSVTFRLTKRNHELHISYGAIQQQLEKQGVDQPTIQEVSKAVIAIRQSKLPDPKELGNSGSFFKNPVIGKTQFQTFRLQFPEAPFYEVSPKEFKIPAGWLIEQAGFKGKRFGEVGVHKNQALVLVNYGNGTGEAIWELALTIQREIKKKFGIYLEPEVNII